MGQIRPWPPLKEDDPKLYEMLDWCLFADKCPWKLGQLYRVNVEIPASKYLFKQEWYHHLDDIVRPSFVIRPDYLIEKFGVSEAEAKHSYFTICPGDVFMLIGTYYDDFIFSVLLGDRVLYVSREEINMHRSAVLEHGEEQK